MAHKIPSLQVEKYAGDRSHEDLKKFAVTMLGKEEEQEGQKRLKDDPHTPVVVLTSENFENAIKKGYSMVKFFAPWYGSWFSCFLFGKLDISGSVCEMILPANYFSYIFF